MNRREFYKAMQRAREKYGPFTECQDMIRVKVGDMMYCPIEAVHAVDAPYLGYGRAARALDITDRLMGMIIDAADYPYPPNKEAAKIRQRLLEYCE
jgi:hypothetical protein